MLNIEKLIGLRHVGGADIGSDISFAELLLKEKGVAVVPGSAFGLAHFVRISFATQDEDIIKACERINSFVSDLS